MDSVFRNFTGIFLHNNSPLTPLLTPLSVSVQC